MTSKKTIVRYESQLLLPGIAELVLGVWLLTGWKNFIPSAREFRMELSSQDCFFRLGGNYFIRQKENPR